MKTRSNKQLKLNKRTIAELNDNDLNEINGGAPSISIIIETIIRTGTYGTWIDHGPL